MGGRVPTWDTTEADGPIFPVPLLAKLETTPSPWSSLPGAPGLDFETWDTTEADGPIFPVPAC
jgi:hypothetical protein